MNQKSVVLVGSYTKSLINFRKQLIVDLLSRGYKVIAMAPDKDGVTEQELDNMGVFFQQIPLKRTGINPISDLRSILFLHHFLKKLKPDVVIAYTIKPVIYANLIMPSHVKSIALITGLGYLDTGTLTLKKNLIRKLIFFLYRFALRNLQYCAFQNPDDKMFFHEHKLLRQATKQTITAGSGVDLNHYARSPATSSKVIFLLIARLIRAKGIDYYFNAAEELKARYGDVVDFQLIGMLDEDNPDAIDKERLLKLAARGVINYLGEKRDVRPYLAASSVFVLPTYYREGTPRTILEALAMAKPVITTDSPGCRETVFDGINGFLIPKHDTRSLIHTMNTFLEDRSLIKKMGDESYKLAQIKYDVNLVNKQLFDFANI